MTTTTTRTTTTTTSTYTGTTTTTTRTPIKELVCTIGAYATQAFSYPEDGLCHYLFYYKLYIDQRGVVHGVSDDWSWDLYKERMQIYNSTKGGMAFDITYVQVNLARIQYGDIENHARNGHNIANYGVLDIVAEGRYLEGLVERAKRFLSVRNMAFIKPYGID
ncbi:uncharacterized protein LOC144148572 [Haemaphysalis longicornis]